MKIRVYCFALSKNMNDGCAAQSLKQRRLFSMRGRSFREPRMSGDVGVMACFVWRQLLLRAG
jgi:ADP-dependent phosphofructokinase/glucokinase